MKDRQLQPEVLSGQEHTVRAELGGCKTGDPEYCIPFPRELELGKSSATSTGQWMGQILLYPEGRKASQGWMEC